MADDELKRYPDEQPDWRKVHQTIHRVDRSWPILKPIEAVVTNWKAWLVAAMLYTWFRSPEIIKALDSIAGVGQ